MQTQNGATQIWLQQEQHAADTCVVQCSTVLCVPEEGRSFAWQPLQVVPPGRGRQGLHICPVGGPDDVKQRMQLCLRGAVDGAHLTICLPAQGMIS